MANALAPPHMARASLFSRTSDVFSILRTVLLVPEIGFAAAFAMATFVRHALSPSVYPLRSRCTTWSGEYPHEKIYKCKSLPRAWMLGMQGKAQPKTSNGARGTRDEVATGLIERSKGRKQGVCTTYVVESLHQFTLLSYNACKKTNVEGNTHA